MFTRLTAGARSPIGVAVMNAYGRKSANFLALVSWPAGLRIACLIASLAITAGLSIGLGGPVIDRSFGPQLGCPEPAARATDLSINPTGSRFSSEARLLFSRLLAAEQRRVCTWKHLSERNNRAVLGLCTWFSAIALGFILSTYPLRHRLMAWLRPAVRRRPTPNLPAPDDGRFAHSFGQAQIGMMLVSVTETGRFIYSDINPAWQQMFGQAADHSRGREPHDVWPTQIADAIVERFRRCVFAGRTLHYELNALADGERNLVVAITPVRDLAAADGSPGPIIRLLCLARDNTEQAQRALRVQHEQRLETIRRLSAGVAHDFNNILQAICGGLELIIDEAGPAHAICDLANIALVAAQRGSHLTQHLLAYARRQVLDPQPVDLKKFLTDMHFALEQAIGPGADLELAFCGEHAAVFADEMNLRIALLNLAFNAGRAMGNAGRLRIETSPDTSGQQPTVRILVSDTGAGMDEATLARCYEPFFTTKGASGTGLGLSMVQGFAVQSGGELRLSSKPGQGTSAMLTLPACQVQSATSFPLPAQHPRGRVLLVDDAADVLVTTGRMLERSGLEVVPVQSGDAALALLAEGEVFDVLVTDYAMPGLSGVELIRLAREMQPDLPGLIITGFHEVDIGLLRETANVLRKPFQRQDLLDAVQEQIRNTMVMKT